MGLAIVICIFIGVKKTNDFTSSDNDLREIGKYLLGVTAITMAKVVVCFVSPLGFAFTFSFLGEKSKCAVLLIISAFVLFLTVWLMVKIVREWKKPNETLRAT